MGSNEKIDARVVEAIDEMIARVKVEALRLEAGDVIELLSAEDRGESTEIRYRTTTIGGAMLQKVQESNESVGIRGPRLWRQVLRANTVGRHLTRLSDVAGEVFADWMAEPDAKAADVALAASFLASRTILEVEGAISIAEDRQADLPKAERERLTEYALATVRFAIGEGAEIARTVRRLGGSMERGEVSETKGPDGRTTQVAGVSADASRATLDAIADALGGRTQGEA